MAREPTTLNDVENALLTWYYDRFLSGVILGTGWDEKIRYFHLPTDVMKMELEPADAPHKVIVPVTLEAFGLFTLDNCGAAWIKQFELKRNDSAAVIPRGKDDVNGDYKAKWNLPDSGSKEFNGIAVAGLQVRVNYADFIILSCPSS